MRVGIEHPHVLCNSIKHCLKLEMNKNNYPGILRKKFIREKSGNFFLEILGTLGGLT